MSREYLFEQFQKTPEEDRPSFCFQKFGQQLAVFMAYEEDHPTGSKQSTLLDKFIDDLEWAVKVAANREDLWNEFLRRLNDLIKKRLKLHKKRSTRS